MLQPLEIRRTIMQMCYTGGEGHIPSCFSVVEILIALYENVLRYQSQNPYWEDRDYTPNTEASPIARDSLSTLLIRP